MELMVGVGALLGIVPVQGVWIIGMSTSGEQTVNSLVQFRILERKNISQPTFFEFSWHSL